MKFEDVKRFNSKIIKGESFNIKDLVEFINEYFSQESKEELEKDLSRLTVKQLKKIYINSYGFVPSTKKADIIKDIYVDQQNQFLYFLSDSKNISFSLYGNRSVEEQMKDKIFEVLMGLTQEKLDSICNKRKKDYNELMYKIKYPKTKQEYETASNYRRLTIEEKRTYERLYTDNALSVLDKTKMVTGDVSDYEDYSVTKTKDTRDNSDLWVVKFAHKSYDFKNINSKMKELGGKGYSRFTKGFNFYFDPTELLEKKYHSSITTKCSNSEKLRKLADSLQETIDYKLREDKLTNTARRVNIANNMEKEGYYLKKIQAILNTLADSMDREEVKYLKKISNKAQIETFEYILKTAIHEFDKAKDTPEGLNPIDIIKYPLSSVHISGLKALIADSKGIKGTAKFQNKIKKYIEKHDKNLDRLFTGHDSPMVDVSLCREEIATLYGLLNTKITMLEDEVAIYKRLKALKIINTYMLRTFMREYVTIREKAIYNISKDVEEDIERKKLNRSIVTQKIDGYFPTPKNIVDMLIDKACIKENDTILEPSAGSGHIADVIRKNNPDNKLEVAEINLTLREILINKNYNVIGDDFLKINKNYDKIIMNPPFERNQDIQHIQHAYDLLNDGGRLVAIISEHGFFCQDKTCVEFRQWLQNVKANYEKLPEGSFKNSDRSTGVNTRIVVIDKKKNDNKSNNLDNKEYFIKVLKKGICLNKYSATFNNLYHKKILQLLKEEDPFIQEFVCTFCIYNGYKSIEQIRQHDVGILFNSKDFKREDNVLKENILSSLKNLIKPKIPMIRETVKAYQGIEYDVFTGVLMDNLTSVLKKYYKINKMPYVSLINYYYLAETEEQKVLMFINNLFINIKIIKDREDFINVLNKYVKYIDEKYPNKNLLQDIKMSIISYLQFLDETIITNKYRYYLVNRPIDIGTFPKGIIGCKSFDKKEYVATIDMEAYGYVEYDTRLSDKSVKDYELVEEKEIKKEVKKQIDTKQTKKEERTQLKEKEEKKETKKEIKKEEKKYTQLSLFN